MQHSVAKMERLELDPIQCTKGSGARRAASAFKAHSALAAPAQHSAVAVEVLESSLAHKLVLIVSDCGGLWLHENFDDDQSTTKLHRARLQWEASPASICSLPFSCYDLWRLLSDIND